jgi:hypothetical protein
MYSEAIDYWKAAVSQSTFLFPRERQIIVFDEVQVW